MTSVSVLCITYNRQFLIPFIIHQFKNQEYDGKLELIIYDDSNMKIFFENEDNRITYIYSDRKETIGFKRNYLNSIAKGDIIIWFDDDDFYIKDRIAKSVDIFEKNPNVEIIGAKSMVLFDLQTKLSVCIPVHNLNSTQNNILAYRRSYLNEHCYDEHDETYEESFFTKKFTSKCYQFRGIDLVIHIVHSRNTVSKQKFLKNKYLLKNFNAETYIDKKSMMYLEYINNLPEIHFSFINLSADVERNEFMNHQLSKFKNLTGTRFNAIDRVSIKNRYKTAVNNKSTIEEICCMSSHLNVFKNHLANTLDKNDFFVVFEDDIYLKEDINNIDSIVLNAPEDWEILQLHHVCLKKNKSEKKQIWVPWKQEYFCTTFYAIKKNIASKILKKYTYDSNKSLCFDYTICEKDRIQADLLIFRESPFTYTLLDRIAKTNTKFDSNIQSNWKNKKLLIEKYESE